MIKRMRLYRHATLWEAEGEITEHPEWKNRKAIWEPLETHAPQDAEPYCCYLNTVIFYENRNTGSAIKEITRCEHYNLAAAPSPHLLYVENSWWEVGSGKAVWRNDQWYFMYALDRNTRTAARVNAGFWAFALREKQPPQARPA